MKAYVGIDLGTSSCKLLLMMKDGTILNTVSKEYPVYYPQSGWSQQNPQDWYDAVIAGLKELICSFDGEIAGLSFGGQMHGLVALDKDDEVIRPAILWNDGRTQKEVNYLNEVIGKERLSKYTANIAFAGFTAPKIMWLKENEPANYDRITKIMLPKDYLVYRLTGIHATDYSDASGTLLLDVENKKWSDEMCKICFVDENWLPQLYESFAAVGYIKKEILDDLGLKNEILIAAGAGDNAAAAIGTATVEDGSCNISLGTSGTVFISQDNFSVDSKNGLHSFAHASGKYHLMGCILSAASCNQWWLENVLKTENYDVEFNIEDQILGENEVYFLPYLMGERSPHNDSNARASFVGMRPNTSRNDMNHAIMEGVAFALRDCVEIARASGLKISSTKLCGGGAKSKLWQKIIANVLNMNVVILENEQGPAFGAAICAMVASREYNDLKEAVRVLVKEKETIVPDAQIVLKYEKKYQHFTKIYPCLKELFQIL